MNSCETFFVTNNSITEVTLKYIIQNWKIHSTFIEYFIVVPYTFALIFPVGPVNAFTCRILKVLSRIIINNDKYEIDIAQEFINIYFEIDHF